MVSEQLYQLRLLADETCRFSDRLKSDAKIAAWPHDKQLMAEQFKLLKGLLAQLQ